MGHQGSSTDPKWVKSIISGTLEKSKEKVSNWANIIIYGFESVNDKPNERSKAVLAQNWPNFTFYEKRK